MQFDFKTEWLYLIKRTLTEHPEWLVDTVTTAVLFAQNGAEKAVQEANLRATDAETVAGQFYSEKKMASMSEPNRLRVIAMFARSLLAGTPFFQRMQERFGK